MAKQQQLDSDNWDRCAVRLWLSYQFWKPADFAENHGISERTVRYLISRGMPAHGIPRKGSENGLRLSASAATWLMTYRALTVNSTFRFSGMPGEFLDDLSLAVSDEAMAYHLLYGGPKPSDDDLDKYLSPREAAKERRSWRVSFREVKRRQCTV